MLGTPSVANATGSKFIYDDSRYFGILELLKWLLGLFWLFGSSWMWRTVVLRSINSFFLFCVTRTRMDSWILGGRL